MVHDGQCVVRPSADRVYASVGCSHENKGIRAWGVLIALGADIDVEKTRLTAWTLHPREMTWSLKLTSKQQNRETEMVFSMTVMHLHPVDPTMSHADPNA